MDGHRPPQRGSQPRPTPACSLRAYSTAAATERTTFGGLADKDRIFTNIYGRHDPFIKVRAAPRVGGAAAAPPKLRRFSWREREWGCRSVSE